MFPVLISFRQRIALFFHALHDGIDRWMKPHSVPLLLGTIADLGRGKSTCLIEVRDFILCGRFVDNSAFQLSPPLLLDMTSLGSRHL